MQYTLLSLPQPGSPRVSAVLLEERVPTMLQNISLRLARSPGHPEGSSQHGYDIVAPLDGTGHLDADGWRKARDRCRVRRIRAGEPVRHGRLVHRAGGANGATWLIDYDDRTTADDEPGYRLDTHRFVEGEYVSVRDEEGALQTFAVTHVGEARP